MKRILFVSPLADLTGAPKCVLVLTEQIDKSKFLPIVVCPPGGDLVNELRERGIEVHTISKSGFENMGVRGFKKLSFFGKIKFGLVQIHYMASLSTIIMRERINCVHINTMMEPFGAIAAKICGRRVVWNVLEIFPDSMVSRILTKLIEHLADMIVIASNAVGQQFRGISEGKIGKWALVYIGIDPELACSSFNGEKVKREFGISASSPVVSLIGSPSPRKGAYFFVQAAAQILQSYPNTTFLILGATPQGNAYERKVYGLVTELDLSDKVIFAGQRKDLFDVLDAIDILVVPSLQDPFPWIVLEGMAMSKPVVASDVGGIGEAVLNGITGIMVPAADSGSIASAVVSLLSDRERAISMGQRGRERVLDLFSQNLYIQSMEKVYLEALGIPAKRI